MQYAGAVVVVGWDHERYRWCWERTSECVDGGPAQVAGRLKRWPAVARIIDEFEM